MFSHIIRPDLELRLLQPQHAAEMFALVDANRAHARRWLPWLDSTQTLEDTELFIDRSLRDFAATGAFTAGIWYEGHLAGAIGIHHVDWENQLTLVGYWLAEKLEGRGIMTHCCRQVVAHAFQELELNRVVIMCATGNRRSQGIPERLGFIREGVLREAEWLYDHRVDLVVYGLLRSDWERGAGAGNG